MKKLIICLSMALAVVAAASAEVSVGVKGIGAFGLGTTLAKETQDNLDSMEALAKAMGIDDYNCKINPTFGGGFGLYGRYNLDPLPALGFQAEFDMLFNNGMEIEQTYAGNTSKMGIFYNTIEIPILVVYDIKAGPVTIGINAGPNFVIPFGKAKTTYTGYDPSEEEIQSTFIVGAIGGVDARFAVGPVNLGAGVQYEADFMPFKIDDTEYFTRRGLRLNLGCEYKF